MIAKFEIPNIFVAIACAVFCSQYAAAQFYTVTKDSPVTVEMHKREIYNTDNKNDSAPPQISSIPETVIGVKNMPQTLSASTVTTSKSHFRQAPVSSGLPDLTIPNLIAEIEKNGIKYPKIVLSQAILETGRSNPRSAATNTTFSGLQTHGQVNTTSSTTGLNQSRHTTQKYSTDIREETICCG